jgi:hypothetical protein
MELAVSVQQSSDVSDGTHLSNGRCECLGTTVYVSPTANFALTDGHVKRHGPDNDETEDSLPSQYRNHGFTCQKER